MPVESELFAEPLEGSSRASPKDTCFTLSCSQPCAQGWSTLPGITYAICTCAQYICFMLLLVLQVTAAMEEGSLVHLAMYVRQGLNPAR